MQHARQMVLSLGCNQDTFQLQMFWSEKCVAFGSLWKLEMVSFYKVTKACIFPSFVVCHSIGCTSGLQYVVSSLWVCPSLCPEYIQPWSDLKPHPKQCPKSVALSWLFGVCAHSHGHTLCHHTSRFFIGGLGHSVPKILLVGQQRCEEGWRRGEADIFFSIAEMCLRIGYSSHPTSLPNFTTTFLGNGCRGGDKLPILSLTLQRKREERMGQQLGGAGWGR